MNAAVRIIGIGDMGVSGVHVHFRAPMGEYLPQEQRNRIRGYKDV